MFLFSNRKIRAQIADLNLRYFVRDSGDPSIAVPDASDVNATQQALLSLKSALSACFSRLPAAPQPRLGHRLSLYRFSWQRLWSAYWACYASPERPDVVLLCPSHQRRLRPLQQWFARALRLRQVHLLSLAEFYNLSLSGRTIAIGPIEDALPILLHRDDQLWVDYQGLHLNASELLEIFRTRVGLDGCVQHPLTQQPCALSAWLSFAARQYEVYAKNGAQRTTYCYGITLWKRGVVRDYLYAPGGRIRYLRWRSENPPEQSAHTQLLAWGQKRPRFSEHMRMATMEDGFIRSIGLGSDYNLPRSLVVDQRGIYYNFQSDSDLFRMLREARIDESQRLQAQWIREQLVSRGLSKYNSAEQGVDVKRYLSTQKRNVLVVGQVDDDASIRCSTDAVQRCQDLILAARRSSPDAHLIYRPHPDVMAGNRRSHVDPQVLAKSVDVVVEDVSTVHLLPHVQEVHTMTSTVGFEALLRKIPVYCYGMPFYAGWGLTRDALRCAGRTRALDLDTLCYVVLLQYPRYLDLETGLFIQAQDLITQLSEELEAVVQTSGAKSRRHRFMNKYINIAKASLT